MAEANKDVPDGIILNSQGKPYGSVEGANKRRLELETDNPEKQYNVFRYGDGYAIIETEVTSTDRAAKEAAAKGASLPKDDGESEFVRVTFHAKSNPEDTDSVWLAANGVALHLKREVEVVIPRIFMEVAKHTTREVATRKPGEGRKVVGRVCTFPFTYIGPGSKEEYLKMKAEGASALKAASGTA